MNSNKQILDDVSASMAIENMPLSENDRNRILYCLENPSKLNKIVSELVSTHTIREKITA
ncbi:MAG: hypothetical protein MJ250_08030 [Alphaproteobacteria bacterium]|nr:hypothetical protein [Alphaproteobacteria bacterium]